MKPSLKTFSGAGGHGKGNTDNSVTSVTQLSKVT
jgi:hypothetical protein